MKTNSNVLVVDDERAHRLMLRAHLEDEGYGVIEAGDGQAALVQLDSEPIDLVLLDQVMPRMDGVETLARIKAARPDLPVLMMTAFGSIDNAVKALKAGADDYLTKPLDVEEVLIKVGRRLEQAAMARRVEDQARRLGERFDFSAMIGNSPPMLRLKESLAMVAPTNATVLITGDSGTGKEVASQTIHQNSKRANGPLVGVNCAALPENLLESELFGHEKGAFTGAINRRDGRFKVADGGTLFLDEIGEMNPSTQAKLLRVLQDGQYTPVGSDKVLFCDVRIIAATNRDLKQAVAEHEFREDLYYRLNVVNIEMPPLRIRGEDIMLMAQHFLKHFAEEHGRSLGGYSQAARSKLMGYHWPGNVRELINAVERAVIMSVSDVVQAEDLPLAINEQTPSDEMALRPGMTVRQAERSLIVATLEATGGNRTQAAQMLGITRKTLQNKIKEYEGEGLNL